MLRYLFCVLLLPATVLSATPALAVESDNALSASLSVREADVRDPVRARAFYQRLETVAHQVCDTAPNADPIAIADNADCREHALDEAVRRINRDTLTAVRQADVHAKAMNPRLHARR